MYGLITVIQLTTNRTQRAFVPVPLNTHLQECYSHHELAELAVALVTPCW